MKPQHTPTPWRIGGSYDTAIIASLPDYSVVIAEANKVDIGSDDLPAEANAAHIVKCVNLHDKLVEALNKIAQYQTDAMNEKDPVKKQKLYNMAGSVAMQMVGANGVVYES